MSSSPLCKNDSDKSEIGTQTPDKKTVRRDKIRKSLSPKYNTKVKKASNKKDKTVKDVKSNDKETKNDDITSEIVDKKNVLLESLEENIGVRGENPDVVDGNKKIRNAFEVMMVKNDQIRGDSRSHSPHAKRLKRLKSNRKNDEEKKGSMLKWLKKE